MRSLAVFLTLVISGSAAFGQSPKQHQLADSTGQVWTSHDPVWLRKWVDQRNAGATAGAQTVVNYGVDQSHFPRFEAGQHSKTWGTAGDTTTATAKPEIYLTVVGQTGEAASAGLRAWELDPAFESLRKSMGSRLAVHAYPKGHPVIRNLKIEADGSPDVLIQDACGMERARYYSDPGVNAIVGQLRRADPNYVPGRSDQLAGDEPTRETVIAVGLLAFVGVGFVCLIFLATRRS